MSAQAHDDLAAVPVTAGPVGPDRVKEVFPYRAQAKDAESFEYGAPLAGSRTVNPDGSLAGMHEAARGLLGDVPEPTEAQLAAIEAAEAKTPVNPDGSPATLPSNIMGATLDDPEPPIDAPSAEGNSTGGPAKA